MSPVPPERTSLGDVTLPPTDPALKAALSEAPPDRRRHKEPEQIGQYRILGKIGEGGMGVVYKAEQREPVRRVVALKIIKLGMDSKEVVARFEAERQALALMAHPNVAKVFEAGMTEAGRTYFAMELVPGVPVTRYCDEERLTIRQRLELFVPICQAVQHAHQKGIIHRDLKPSNILVQLTDGNPVPKVIDFGVAKATNQALTPHTLYTQTGTVVGTPEYMSPEQAMSGGLDVDTRTDIYSLGVILYELLTGTLPVESKSLRSAGLEGMARLLKDTEPPKPSTRLGAGGTDDGNAGGLRQRIAKSRHSELSALRRELRGDLDWIVLKAMEKERARRYETANGLAVDIQRHLNDEPVSACPPSTLYRFRKLVRRNRLAFVGTSAFLLALLLGLITSTWLFVRESQARHRAVIAEHEQVQLRQEAQSAQAKAEAQEIAARQQELAARQRAYASDLNRVQQSLAINNLGRAQELLNRQRPNPGQQDLRGWEWRYLWQLCRSDAEYTLCQRPSLILSVTVSQDGSQVAVAAYGSTGGISVWDLRAHRLVEQIGAGDGMVSAAFSPRDHLLALGVVQGSGSARPRYSVRLWDSARQQTRAELPLDSRCLWPVFSGDGRTLVVCTDSQIILYQVPDGKKVATYTCERGGTNPLGTGFAVTRDLRFAAYGSTGGVIHVMDLNNGSECWHTNPHDAYVTALAFSPDGRTLFSAVGFEDSSIQMWDTASGSPIGSLDGHRAWVGCLVFWPDGKTLASGSADQTIRIWDIHDPAHVPPPRVLRGHRLEVWRLALLPDNRTLISGCKDGSVYVWDTDLALRQRAAGSTIKASVKAWRFMPDGSSVLTVDTEGHVARWRGSDLRESDPLMEIGAVKDLRTVISPDCRLIAVGPIAGAVRIWDVARRERLREFQVGSLSSVPAVFLGPDKLAVFCETDRSLHEWNLTTWQEMESWQCPAPLSQVSFSPDGRWCLMPNGRPDITTLEDLLQQRQFKRDLDTAGGLNTAFSPDGKFVALTSTQGITKLLDMPTLRETANLGGFLLGVESPAFSPDGTRLAVSSTGKEAVKLWDVQSQQELLTLAGEGSIFSSTAFSTDGSALGSVSVAGRLELWRAPSWAQIEAAERD
jgi:WD40 repeat protein/serine/threonine protein kinase